MRLILFRSNISVAYFIPNLKMPERRFGQNAMNLLKKILENPNYDENIKMVNKHSNKSITKSTTTGK